MKVHPRIPLIPGVTDSKENLSAIVDLLVAAGAGDVTLIPYNPLGLETAVGLGRDVGQLPRAFVKSIDETKIHETFREIVKRKGQRTQLNTP